jgi:protein-tyrosine phosphatase
VEQEWLDSAFDQVVASYGNFDRYVSEGLRSSPAEVDVLKQRMLG